LKSITGKRSALLEEDEDEDEHNVKKPKTGDGAG